MKKRQLYEPVCNKLSSPKPSQIETTTISSKFKLKNNLKIDLPDDWLKSTECEKEENSTEERGDVENSTEECCEKKNSTEECGDEDVDVPSEEVIHVRRPPENPGVE